MSSGLMPLFSRARHDTRSATRCWGSIAIASRGEIPKNSGSNVVAPLRNPPRSWISLKPLRRDPANSSRTDQPRSVGNGLSASRPWTSNSQYASAVSIPPGASSAIPTITTGSPPSANLSSATGVHLRGDGVDVIVEVEVSTVVPGQIERAGGVLLPEMKFQCIDAWVAAGSQYGNVGRDLNFGATGIAIDRRIIGPYRGDQQLGELWVGKQIGICPTEIDDIDDQVVMAGGQIRLGCDGRRRGSRRRPQPFHCGAARFGDPGELEGDDSAHAVTEQSQRCHLAPWAGDEQTAGQILDGLGGGLAEPFGALRILHDVRVARRGQCGCQLAIAHGRSAGMRKHHGGARATSPVATGHPLDPGRELLLRHRCQIVENHCTASFPAMAAATWQASMWMTSRYSSAT